MESIKVRDLDEFLDLSASSDKDFEYTVSWLDSLARGRNSGKGVFSVAIILVQEHKGLPTHRPPKFHGRSMLPTFFLTSRVNKAFNFAYYNKQFSRKSSQRHTTLPSFHSMPCTTGTAFMASEASSSTSLYYPLQKVTAQSEYPSNHIRIRPGQLPRGY